MKTISGNRQGITLVELLVVISIISILVVAMGFSYEGWSGSYKVESELNQLYADLAGARTMAMEQNRDYFVKFPSATSYTMYRDPAVDGNGLLDETGSTPDQQLTGYPKSVKYQLTWGGGGYITFDSRGFISGGSISVPPAAPTTDGIRVENTQGAAYDCILLSTSDISEGKWGDCDNDGTTPEGCCVK